MTDTSDANMVGKLFFNIVQIKCFVLVSRRLEPTFEILTETFSTFAETRKNLHFVLVVVSWRLIKLDQR